MKNYLICICLLMSHFGMAQNKHEKAILETLNQQIKAWNQGDTKSFMIGYWENDSLMFIGKSGITFSHQETLARYQKNYPDKATMGTLKFDILRMKRLGRKNYFVVGKWHLTRPEKGDVEGHFTLVFEKIKGIWVIIADHSS